MLVGANISMVLDKFSYQQFVKDRWGSVLRTINSIIIENMITVIYISVRYITTIHNMSMYCVILTLYMRDCTWLVYILIFLILIFI